MFSTIRKRNGDVVAFQPEKITRAIFKAANAVGGKDWAMAEDLTSQVIALATEQYPDRTVDVESIQDLVEKVLIENGHAKTAKAYILYREKRRSAREANALIGATIEMFSNYMGDNDWRVKENANAQKSINGMNNYIRETFTKQYWLLSLIHICLAARLWFISSWRSTRERISFSISSSVLLRSMPPSGLKRGCSWRTERTAPAEI